MIPEDPVTRFHALITQYTVITGLPDIESYSNIKGNKPGRCIFRGCTEPIAWEDNRGENFLCEGHYILIKQWVDDARKGLVPGKHAAIFSQDPGQSS